MVAKWEIICYLLIPLLTHVSFRCTVPLKGSVKISYTRSGHNESVEAQ
jgi:hypothetical protein